MKSILSNKCCDKVLPFPKLMKGVYSGNVALFRDACDAVYVHVPFSNSSRVGDRVFSTSPANWKDYDGDVCLTNK